MKENDRLFAIFLTRFFGILVVFWLIIAAVHWTPACKFKTDQWVIQRFNGDTGFVVGKRWVEDDGLWSRKLYLYDIKRSDGSHFESTESELQLASEKN